MEIPHNLFVYRCEGQGDVMGKRNTYGPLLVLLGAILWSTNAPFIKVLQVDSYLTIFLRAAIAGLILLPALRPGKIKWNRYLLIMLLSYTALCVGIVLAIRNTSANIATGMQYTAPLLIFLLSWRRGEVSFSWRRNWPMAVLLCGLVICMFSGGSSVTWQGNLYALSTSISFTAMTIASKKATTDNPLGMVSLTNLFCAAVTLLFFVPRPIGAQFSAITAKEWVILLFLGSFQIAAGYALYYTGLRTTEPSQAAMLAPCEMVLGPLWVAVFVHEYPDWIGLTGSLLIVLGVIGEVLVSRKDHVTVPSDTPSDQDGLPLS